MPLGLNNRWLKKSIYLSIFAISMAYFEAAVVVYLRELYYPEGFAFPLKIAPNHLIIIELFRELATMMMLVMVAAIIGRRLWERFGYFILLFGIWDIFFYIWLKATIGWPSSLFEWDILFLIPLPWIGPVIAPVAVSVVMVVIGISLTRLYAKGLVYKPSFITWLLAIIGTAMILYSFMYDLDATLRFQMPKPYHYWLLISGLTIYAVAYLHSYRRVRR